MKLRSRRCLVRLFTWASLAAVEVKRPQVIVLHLNYCSADAR
jgi:hypothetical protein